MTPVRTSPESSRSLSRGAPTAKTDSRITDELAYRVMGWTARPDRFIKTGRSWIPRWRFQPLNVLADAFQLLDRADSFTLTSDPVAGITATVEIARRQGCASGKHIARTVAIAVARSIGLEV